jgi:hypothetical protein
LKIKTLKILPFTALILFSVNAVFSQSNTIGSWNILNIKHQHSERLSLFGEGQIRSLSFYNNFHYFEYQAGFAYKLHPNFLFTLGTGNYQTFKEGGNFIRPQNNNEIRIWPQITLFNVFDRFSIEHRYRLEMRWTSNGYKNRYRYRFGLKYPIPIAFSGAKKLAINLSNELFFTDTEPYFERNRILGGIEYKLSEFTSIQLGYLHQLDYKINDETGRDFIQLGISFELKNQKKI